MTSLKSFAQSQSNHVFEDWAKNRGVQEFFYKNVTVSDSDRNIYVAGATLSSEGDYDLLLTKYDKRGQELWSETIAGTGGGNDFATDIALDAQQNVIICGSISETGTEGNNMLVVKYDPDGFEYWRKSYDYNGANEAAAAVCIDAANSVYCTGATQDAFGFTDMLTIKLDSSSQVVWEQTHDYNELHDFGVKIGLSGSRVVVTGVGQFNAATWHALTLNYQQSSGNLIGSVNSGSATPGIEEVTDLFIDDQENIYVAGSRFSGTAGYNMLLIKLDEDLNIEWTREWDGDGMNDKGSGVRVAPNGDVYLSGTTQTPAQGTDVVLLKYNQNGDLIWTQTYDGQYSGDDESAGLEWHPNGYLYVAGSSFVVSNLDYLTLKYDTTGTLIWSMSYNSPYNKDDRGTNLALDSHGDVVVTGQCETDLEGRTTYYAVKYVEKSVIDPYANHSLPTNKFIKPNYGQLKTTEDSLAGDVMFINDRDYPRSYVLSDRISYVLRKPDMNTSSLMINTGTDTTLNYNLTDTLVRVDMKPRNPNADRRILPFQLRPYFESYFLAHFDNKRVNTYEKVIAFDMWHNVDMILSNEDSGLGIGLVCKPNFKADDLAWEYEGADLVEITASNSLLIHTEYGNIEYVVDFAQEVSASGTLTALSWQPQFNLANGLIKLQLGAFDISKPLILNLSKTSSASGSSSGSGNLEWSTFYGGSDSEVFRSAVSDDNGNGFIAGETQSDNFPVTPGVFQFEHALNTDACIVKFDHETLNNEWATYYGGSGIDRANDLAIDNNGDIIFCGLTYSSDFPKENEIQTSVGSGSGFVGKLNSAGAVRHWATPFGPFTFNTFTSVALDNQDNVYCVGHKIGEVGSGITMYPQAGTTSYSAKSGIILKLSNSAEPLWSTTFGHHAFCRINGIAIDQNNNKYITGATRDGSTTEPTIDNNPNFNSSSQYEGGNGFIAKFDANDNIDWSSWYGGTNTDQGEAVAVNNAGSKVCIVGATASATGLTLQNPLPGNTTYGGDNGQTPIGSIDHHGDGFIAEFASNGTLLFGSYFGDTQREACLAVAYDQYDQLYVTGYTGSTNTSWLTNTTGAVTGLFSQNSNHGGAADAFIAALNPSRQLVWGSFFGGSQTDIGYGIATTNSDKLFLAGQTFSLASNPSQPFPLSNYTPSANPYFQDELNLIDEYEGEKSDGFVSRFSLLPLAAVVSVRELEGSAQLKVYPNPNNGQFIVDFELLNSSTGQLSIYSIDGRLVFQKQLGHNSLNHIDTPALPSGTYILSLQHEENRYFTKFIKL